MAKPVRVMKPSLAHSPSWVCRLRGVIWRRSASSRPLQPRWGSVVMRAVTRCRRVGGWGGRGVAGLYRLRPGPPVPSGGVRIVMSIAVMTAGSWGRLSSCSW